MIRRFVAWWDGRKVAGAFGMLIAVIGAILALTNDPFAGDDACASSPLRHVYAPGRLHVVATCQRVTLRVVAWRREHDGDVHVNGTVLRGAGAWLDRMNYRGQHGLTVVEFVPGDPRPARFYGGEVLSLLVTKVYDEGHRAPDLPHGWYEGHPVFAARDVTPPAVTPGPDRRYLAPATER